MSAKKPPPCRFCGQPQERHAPDCTRPVIHGAGLVPSTGVPAPPYLRFERKHDADFMVWIAAPAEYDREALTEAMNDPGVGHRTVRLIAAYFGYELTPAEDGLLARFEVKDTGGDFWQKAEAAGLLYERFIEAPSGALQLAGMPHAIGLPVEVARAPVFAAGGSPRGDVQLSLVYVGSLHYRPFNVLEPMGPLTVRDALLLAHITKRYIAAGCPADRWVHLSLNEAARLAGHSGSGVIPRNYVRAAHARMRSTSYQNTIRDADGNLHSLTWGIIDLARTFEPKGSGKEGRASVKLNEAFANLVRGGALAYLDEATFARLVRRDELAARLWVFLETETLDRPWSYSLFSAPRGEIERERDTPAIADLLRMHGWKARRQIAARVKRAAAVIAEVAPTYKLTVVRAKEPSMWTLRAAHRPPRLTAGEVCTPGRAPCVPPVAPPVDKCSAGGYSSDAGGVVPVTGGGYSSDAGGAKTPANDESNENVPSALPSEDPTVSQSFKNLRHMTRVTKDREQEQEKYLGERPADCTDGHLADSLDPLGNLAVIVGDTLTAELALAVCRQHRAASGGQVCVDWDGEEVCPALQAMRGVGIKTLNYINRKTNPVKSPQGYIVKAIERATPDTANLMGKGKEASEYHLDWMRSLAPQTVTISDSPAPTTVDIGELAGNASTKVDAAQADHTAPDPAQAEREAAAQRAASRQRREREKTMTPAEIAADFESRRSH